MGISSLAAKGSSFYKLARFVARKHIRGYTISPEPAFDEEGLDFFKSTIGDSKVYLEYGSGGSTILASRFVAKLVSVENDGLFANAVRHALPPSNADIHLITPNIGMTREWGIPIFKRPTTGRVARWKRYPQIPWEILGSDVPDTILIDGRMRVACVLESLLRIEGNTRLLVDDYVGRDYSTIERFTDLIAIHGRMAVFRKRDHFDDAACRRQLEISYSDWR
jgi:hypothetical protein